MLSKYISLGTTSGQPSYAYVCINIEKFTYTWISQSGGRGEIEERKGEEGMKTYNRVILGQPFLWQDIRLLVMPHE